MHFSSLQSFFHYGGSSKATLQCVEECLSGYSQEIGRNLLLPLGSNSTMTDSENLGYVYPQIHQNRQNEGWNWKIGIFEADIWIL